LIAVIVLILIAWWTSRLSPETELQPQFASEQTAIAVLPFENMSNDPEQSFFSDGIAEDILNELAKNPRLAVRPRSSSFALRDEGLDVQSMGRRLNVTHVLEGSVRRSGNRIRVTSQLNEVASNRSVWSERYERELTEVFAVQDAIVDEILVALNMRIGAARSVRSMPSIEAYDAFLLGRDYFNRNRFSESDRWLQTAVEFDPSYADAWAYLAQNIAWRTAYGMNPSSGVHAAKRREFIETALELEPSNATALATRALAETLYTNRNYEAAINDLIDLVTRQPNNESAHFYLLIAFGTVGKYDHAIRVAERLSELSPESMLYQSALRTLLVQTGPLEVARRSVEEYAERFDYPNPEMELAILTEDVGALEKLVNERCTLGVRLCTYYEALVHYLKRDYAKAQEVASPLRNAESYVPYFLLSRVALLDNDLDAAFEYYYRAVNEAEPGGIQGIQGRRIWRMVYPAFYADSRYSKMLEDFGVDSESVAKMNIRELPF
jgi:TolB-like protein/cytochrome c-type biogenesis protein CcmH/NrfG